MVKKLILCKEKRRKEKKQNESFWFIFVRKTVKELKTGMILFKITSQTIYHKSVHPTNQLNLLGMVLLMEW